MENASDKLIATLVFAELEDVRELKIQSKAEVELYDEAITKIEKEIITEIAEEKDGIINYIITEDKELYKGYIYSGEHTTFNSKSIIDVRENSIIENISIVEGNSKYLVTEEIDANVVYKNTTINKEEIIRQFGENIILKIKNANDNIINEIDKDSEVDGQGNIVVNYNNEKCIKIEISNIEKSGVLELNHSKTILSENLTKEEIRRINRLKTIGNIEENKNINKKENNK